MKINEFAIRRYGPLRDTGKIILSDFNLIYGNNEDGKTLTIDALVKLLLGKASKERDFTAIQRVDEMPDGYIVLTDSDDRQYKLPDHGLLSSVVNISAGDCSNIFIIRNSDLSILSEHSVYTGITERLTGLRTRYINDVVNNLRTLGKITPTGLFVNTGDERLKTRIDEAKTLIESIEEFKAECESKNIAGIEAGIVNTTNRLKSVTVQINAYNEARLREKFEKGAESLGKLINACNAYTSVEKVNETDLQRWRDCENEIERLSEKREESARILQESRDDLNEITEEVKESEVNWNHFEERKRQLDETIRPLIKQHEERLSTVPRFETRRKFFSIAGLLTGALFGISMIGMLILPESFLYITVGLFLLLILSGSLYYLSIRKLSEVSVDFQRLNRAAARYNWDADSLPRILEKLESFEDERRRKFDRLQERRRHMQNLRERVDEISQKTIPEIDHRLQSRKQEIDAIRNTSGEDTLQSYREKLKMKSAYNNDMQTQSELLKRDFGEQSKNINDNISFWQIEIRELAPYKEKAADLVYDERQLRRLESEHRELTSELDTYKKQRSGIQSRMNDIERKANRILQTGEEYIYCKTLHDLTVIQSLLKEFVQHYETLRDAALAAIEVFSAILEDEQKKVGTLFGAGRPVSKYYHHITGGRYTEVGYNQAQGVIEVLSSNGARLPASKLSGGAYDQLYFAIRLALGEELLQGDKGFFILDDPFIKSDIHRLGEQMKMLRDVSGRGWQIIYFSAKSEVLDELTNDINENRIQLIDYRRPT